MVSVVAGVEVGLINGEFVVNPTRQQMKESTLHLTIAGKGLYFFFMFLSYFACIIGIRLIGVISYGDGLFQLFIIKCFVFTLI